MSGQVKLKQQKHQEVCVDSFDGLPREVIDGIMKRLPLHDAARMSALSHKWYGIWTSTPKLNFDYRFFVRVLVPSQPKAYKFFTIVSKILLQHEGPVAEFYLSIPWLESLPDVTPWISHLSRTGIRDLTIDNQGGHPLCLTSHFFSCHGLEKLKLRNCKLNVPPGFKGFQKLRNLDFDSVAVTNNMLNFLTATSPLLQNLSIRKCIVGMDIVIDALNLTCLVVHCEFKSLDIKHSKNIASACLCSAAISATVTKSAGLSFLITTLSSSTKLETLHIRGSIIVSLKKFFLPSTFKKVRTLSLSVISLDNMEEFSSVIWAIQSCPNVQELNISVCSSKEYDVQTHYCPATRLDRLRCANVECCCAFTPEYKLIEFLLASSPILERLSISSTKPIQPRNQMRMMWELNQAQRASDEAKVICPQPCPKKYTVGRMVYERIPGNQMGALLQHYLGNI